MTETFQARAREWLDIQDEELVATTSFRVLLGKFAEMLDQEAQEKPQQPEEIEELDCEANGGDVYAKIQEIIRTLNRLTHKD